jgi:hypothetical protein
VGFWIKLLMLVKIKNRRKTNPGASILLAATPAFTGSGLHPFDHFDVSMFCLTDFLRSADDRKSPAPNLEACDSTFKRQKQTTQPGNNLAFSALNTKKKQKTKNKKQRTPNKEQRTPNKEHPPILTKKITLLNPTQSII